MKRFETIIICVILFSSTLFCNNTDTIPKQRLSKQNTVNFKAGITAGYENGLIGQCDYENSSWGKIMLRTEMATYYNRMLIMDLGTGYGYPFLRYSDKTIFFNSYITFSEMGLQESDLTGPSVMFGLEYRKKWKFISLNMEPFFRQQLLYDVQEYSYNHDLSHYWLNYSYGLNISISLNLPIGKQKLN